MSQGSIRIVSINGRTGIVNCLIVPAEDESDFFFQQFPDAIGAEQYADEYGLTIITIDAKTGELQNDNNSEER